MSYRKCFISIALLFSVFNYLCFKIITTTNKMESEMDWTKTSNHPKTIIHIDIDYFYAQVEVLKEPKYQNEPVGVKQKNIVVTCNYIARRFGVKKCMLITDALALCPNLVLFNGEDLYKYRQASNQIHSLLLTFTSKVEKGGFDENYLDVTELVMARAERKEDLEGVLGHWEGDSNNNCICGCHKRLIIGSHVAHEIRTKLKSDLGFTSCAGISYNKLLAKVSCSSHKPNQQTTLFPNGTLKFLVGLKEVDRIPGIGAKGKHALESVNVRTVQDLQEADLKTLRRAFRSEEAAAAIKNLGLGICGAAVKPSGKPLSIALEDGFRKISVESDVKEKFRTLLQRLMILVEEDGRIPMTVKVTVRKQDAERKIGNKETKQCPVPTCLFPHPVGKLSEESANRLLSIIMGLFCKVVNISQPFHVTLLGLGFTKFHEKVSNRSIASFLLKKRDLSVQSLTSFVSHETSVDMAKSIPPSCSKSESDSETEPSPKKTKLDFLIKKRRLSDEDIDMCSPSKLRVENLNLNAEPERECPPHADPDVFRALPQDLQEEIVKEWRMTHPKAKPPRAHKQSLIYNYCVPKNKT